MTYPLSVPLVPGLTGNAEDVVVPATVFAIAVYGPSAMTARHGMLLAFRYVNITFQPAPGHDETHEPDEPDLPTTPFIVNNASDGGVP